MTIQFIDYNNILLGGRVPNLQASDSTKMHHETSLLHYSLRFVTVFEGPRKRHISDHQQHIKRHIPTVRPTER